MKLKINKRLLEEVIEVMETHPLNYNPDGYLYAAGTTWYADITGFIELVNGKVPLDDIGHIYRFRKGRDIERQAANAVMMHYVNDAEYKLIRLELGFLFFPNIPGTSDTDIKVALAVQVIRDFIAKHCPPEDMNNIEPKAE